MFQKKNHSVFKTKKLPKFAPKTAKWPWNVQEMMTSDAWCILLGRNQLIF